MCICHRVETKSPKICLKVFFAPTASDGGLCGPIFWVLGAGMSFSLLSSFIAGQLPLQLPGVTINGVELGPTRLALDLTDDPGTSFEDRYEIAVTGSFALDGFSFDLSAITGAQVSQLDANGDALAGQTVSIGFRKGGSIDGGLHDMTDFETLLTAPLGGEEMLAQLTAGIFARASEVADHLTGTEFRDIFRLLGGDDVVEAGGGNDRILAGAGDDIVLAGAGRDEVFGGDGDDLIFTNGGADTVEGGKGRDAILLGRGDDIADGGNGSDLLLGHGGDDLLIGGKGGDLLIGGSGSNRLKGGDGHDGLVAGGAGGDYLDGGNGDDVLVSGGDFTFMFGGAGADIFVFKDTMEGFDVISVLDFEDGVDRIALNRAQMDFVQAELESGDSAFIRDEPGNSDMVRIQIGVDTIFISDISLADLTMDDFVKTFSFRVQDALDESAWSTELDPLLLL